MDGFDKYTITLHCSPNCKYYQSQGYEFAQYMRRERRKIQLLQEENVFIFLYGNFNGTC